MRLPLLPPLKQQTWSAARSMPQCLRSERKSAESSYGASTGDTSGNLTSTRRPVSPDGMKSSSLEWVLGEDRIFVASADRGDAAVVQLIADLLVGKCGKTLRISATQLCRGCLGK